MRLAFRTLVAVVVASVVLVALVTAALLLPRGGARVAVRVPPRREPVNTVTDPMPDVYTLAAFVEAVHTDAVLTGVQEWWTQVTAYVEAEAEAARARAVPAVVVPSTPRGVAPGGGGGTITQAQFEALGQCEQSGRDHPFFGRYSIIDGSSGGRSLAEQQAMAQAIYDRAGASAWDGCAYTLGG